MFYKSVFYFNIWLKNIVMYCGCKIITKRLVFHQSPFFFIPVVFFRNAVLSCDHLLLIRRKFSWLMSGRFFVDHFLFRLVFFRARKSAPSSALRWAQMRQSPFCRADLAKARADAKHTQTPNTSRFSPQWERAAWFASLGSSKKREKGTKMAPSERESFRPIISLGKIFKRVLRFIELAVRYEFAGTGAVLGQENNWR